MDRFEGGSAAYGNKARLDALRTNCWEQLRKYALSPDLWCTVQDNTESTRTEQNILVIAERLESTSGQLIAVPYIASFQHAPAPSPTAYGGFSLERDQYCISLQRTDILTEEFRLSPDESVIKRYTDSRYPTGSVSFESQVAQDIHNLRIPTGVEEYAHYYEQYRYSQAYFITRGALQARTPAVIQAKDGLYHLYAKDGSGANDSEFSDIGMTRFDARHRDEYSGQPPRTILLPYGRQPTAFYPQRNSDVSVGVDLKVEMPAGILPTSEDHAPINATITTVDQLIVMLQESSLLPVDEAAAILQRYYESNNKPRSRWLNLRGLFN